MEKTSYSDLKKLILKDSKLISSKHPEEKYRRYTKEREIKYPITNFIDFKVYQESSKKNIKLQTYMFLPDKDKHPEIKGIVYMMHGMQSWAGASASIAQKYTETGCVVVAYDQRGHGYSEGYLGDTEHFEFLIQDAKNFMIETEKYLKEKYYDKNDESKTSFITKRFLHGLSMGGLLCYYLSKDNPHHFKGVIYFAPAFDIYANCFLRILIRIVGSCCNCITIPRATKESEAFKNPYPFENPDPVIDRTRVKIRTVKTMLDYMEKSHKQFSDYEAPFVLVLPGVDKLVPPIRIFEFYEKSKSLDKDCWYYPNMWHVVDLEEEVTEILNKLVNWIEDRL